MPPVALVAANAVALRADARGARARSRRDRATMRHRGTTPLPVDAARLRRAVATASNVSAEAADATDAATSVSRRVVGAASLLASLLSGPAAPALATPPRATFQVAESDFKPLPGTKPPIMYADIKGGAGVEGGAKDGSRVAVHFDVKFRRITVATSRQGAGVTGGTPYGFTEGHFHVLLQTLQISPQSRVDSAAAQLPYESTFVGSLDTLGSQRWDGLPSGFIVDEPHRR